VVPSGKMALSMAIYGGDDRFMEVVKRWYHTYVALQHARVRFALFDGRPAEVQGARGVGGAVSVLPSRVAARARGRQHAVARETVCGDRRT
jgi:hypothetical protein